MAKGNAKEEKFASVKGNKETIFRVSKQIHTEIQDVTRKNAIRFDDGNLSLEEV